ncbi:MAG: glutathione-dependent formaldehyde-activating enzyme family protein [Betaproteobacteria bacterium]|nr:glutathione-dependent formaldehyde-activating enzyme family protein [Betaproteobacteria bacterium]
MKYQGSCHCGNIAFEAEGELDKVMECNCSMCMRRGSMLWFIPAADFTLTTPREKLSTYHFNKHVLDHHFCANCGIAPFSEGKDPKGNATVAVNARCVEGFDPQKVEKMFYDGRDK